MIKKQRDLNNGEIVAQIMLVQKYFADEGVQVNLAVSLHAPNNELRSSIMKINRAFPIEKLFAAIEYYIETTNRRVTFEYIMLNEVNDGVEQALELAELLKNIKKLSYVNLIPYNPVSEHDQYSRSPKERVLAFYDTLKKKGSTVWFVKSMVQILTQLVDNCALTQ